MTRNDPQGPQAADADLSRNPIISETLHLDTLDRVGHILELLQRLDLSEGLTANAGSGLYWIHVILADAIKYVGEKGGPTAGVACAMRTKR